MPAVETPTTPRLDESWVACPNTPVLARGAGGAALLSLLKPWRPVLLAPDQPTAPGWVAARLLPNMPMPALLVPCTPIAEAPLPFASP